MCVRGSERDCMYVCVRVCVSHEEELISLFLIVLIGFFFKRKKYQQMNDLVSSLKLRGCHQVHFMSKTFLMTTIYLLDNTGIVMLTM